MQLREYPHTKNARKQTRIAFAVFDLEAKSRYTKTPQANRDMINIGVPPSMGAIFTYTELIVNDLKEVKQRDDSH
jgi:hypothetical protein